MSLSIFVRAALLPALAITLSSFDAATNTAVAQHNACAWSGVHVGPMTRAFAASLGMNEPYGAIFARPRPGGPAAQAHIEAYDVVTAINGTPLRNWRDFATIVAGVAPGSRLYLTTYRNGQLREARIILGYGKCPGH